MPETPRPQLNGRSLAIRLRRLFLLMRTEGGGCRRESVAIAIGVFIGCLPVYGFHLLVCTVVGTVLQLNRLKMYLAANISNPFVAPWLVFLEVQAGAWLRRGSTHALTVETLKTVSLTTLGADLVVGSVATGAVLGILVGGVTYALIRGRDESDAFTGLVRLASDRYITTGILAWEFARGKLWADPIYRAVVCDGLLTRSSFTAAPPEVASHQVFSGGTILDVGCGMGLSLALLAEARQAHRAGTWPAAWPALPQFERVLGIELRSHVAAVAAAALAGDAEVITGDASITMPARVHTVLLFDVLHLMTRDNQELLLATLASTLDPDGAILIREADAAAGWRFTAVRWGNRLKAVTLGSWRQQFHFRTASEWQACLVRHGLHGELREMSEGTPFANVLFLVTLRQT